MIWYSSVVSGRWRIYPAAVFGRARRFGCKCNPTVQTNTGSIHLRSCPAPWPCPQGAVGIMPRSMSGSCHQEAVTITRGIWSNAGLCRRDQWPKRSLVAIGALPVTGANVRISVAIRGQQAMQHKTASPRLAQNRVTRPRNVLNGRKPGQQIMVCLSFSSCSMSWGK